MRITSLSTMFLASALALGACGGADTPAETTAAAHPGHAVAETPADATKVETSGLKTSHEHGSEQAHGGHEEPHAHDFPGAVNDFHDVMSPIWHSEEQAVCGHEGDFVAGAEAVSQMKAPRGVQVGAWNSAAAELRAKVETMATQCAGDPAAAKATLAEVHDAFHALVELIGHEKHGGR
jgi:hypothetical protein